ncbi:conserved hypothetical protein [Verticillium alfalfae VaMs.102]|uniref:Uncharacterized protein n=1 Tax=Verticillium alfalfae (strain VaMs.102 / ATCC MYA-4576 / FGSC 10136) TaxID=526221 RepID=C9SKN4_VERA1|nr:conserved hypothetical protein [Verticillium alfalfae VaMs.102]EEY19252.1 conserved hypothetical protein [Verticillium alfalfae VaMs.102]
MIPGLLRSNKVAGVVAGSVLLIVIFIGLAHNRVDSWDFASISPGSFRSTPEHHDSWDDMRKFFLEEVAKPSIELDAKVYKPYGAFEWKLPADKPARWTKPLGRNLCIFDLDNRPFEEDGMIFGQQPLSWNNATAIHGLSLGVLQHWLYVHRVPPRRLGTPSDQGGFGNFIRYDYANEVKELPCAEANGFPEDRSECIGTFIKHLWAGKQDLIKIAIGQQIPGMYLEMFHKQMLAEKSEYYLTEEQLMSPSWANVKTYLGTSSPLAVDP